MKKLKVIGLMSGTSLDGLDIAFCEFEKIGNGWVYEIIKAETINYDSEQKSSLAGLYGCSGQELIAYDREFGRWMAQEVNNFQQVHALSADFISSHGHTVFHQPSKGFTFQAGSGADLSAATNLPVVCDFRSMDVALGGQGAPLVPIGDEQLFKEYTAALNLGGIANISFDKNGIRYAYDICPVNFVLNELSQRLGKSYDDRGKLAGEGRMDLLLFKLLEKMSYYLKPYPKSMGREYIEDCVMPQLPESVRTEDLLATFCKHISSRINHAVNEAGLQGNEPLKVLVTGGGAFNDFLMKCLSEGADGNVQYILPSNEIIMFKEALIFAFLGVLRISNQSNGLKAVTGSRTDSTGGALHGDFSKILA